MQLVGSDPDCGADYAECYVSDAAAAAALEVIAFPPRWYGFLTEPLIPMLDAVADWAAQPEDPRIREAAMLAESKAQCELLLDVFGNPFRPAAFNPSWRTPDVVTLAGHLYHDRAFGEMLELADALEDAGCTAAGILDHCRGPGPHVRGCWVVDLLLGKS
jgi:hypothetical protein